MLPLLVRVSSGESDVSLSGDPRVNVISRRVEGRVHILHNIQIPHSNNEVSEFTVPLDLGVGEHVPLNEVVKGYDLLVSKVFVSAVHRRE